MSTPPVKHFTSLPGALAGLYGTDTRIVRTDRLSGGDINKAYGLTLSNGVHVFMKANAMENAGFFTAEAAGLAAIATAKKIGTPKILCTGTDPGEKAGYSFLLLVYVESRGKIESYWETFARELASLHTADCSGFVHGGKFGFTQDNYIGATEQINRARSTWVDFFRDCRLVPQFKRASRYFDSSMSAKITKLLDHLDSYMAEPVQPSLLHGDLWGGNVLCGSDGKAWLIDPACYCGSCEADIAMTQLFGGFPETFYKAYEEVNPFQPGYEDRRDLYNLYQLLNHLNIFGTSYLEPVCSIVDEYAGDAS
jgi:fructosamine-3-kinase